MIRRGKREKTTFAKDRFVAPFLSFFQNNQFQSLPFSQIPQNSLFVQYIKHIKNVAKQRLFRRFRLSYRLSFRSTRILRLLGIFGIVATLGAALVGCNGVRRRLTITSEPSGAVVYLNNKEIGKTPISQNFVYSGTYKIRCYKEGYESNETSYRAGTPWYLYPGFDFFSENFVPGEIRDEQSCHITLTQKREIPENELFDAATQLRDEAHNNSSLQYYVGAEKYADPNASQNAATGTN